MAISWDIHLANGKTWGVEYGLFDEPTVCIPVSQIENMSIDDIGQTVLDLIREAKAAPAHELAYHCNPEYLRGGPESILTSWQAELEPYLKRSEAIYQAWINVSAELNRRKARQNKPLPSRHVGPKPGYVYLLQAGPYYKIGISTNVTKRIEQLSTQPPFDVILLHTIKTADMYGIESTLHERFADKRKNGEWFELDPADVEYIKGL